MALSSRSSRPLTFFRLVMINVIAVDSIRTLSFSAVYGFSLVFFYILMALLFFIPTALVAAELGTGWPNRGGIYVWVREAFGKKWSLITIWLNWIYNVFWYPTIMALIAGTIAYLFNPELASNKLYMALSVLILYWLATWVNCLGMRISSFISTLGALVGTLLPMAFISILGLLWIFQGHPMQIELTWEHFFPRRVDGQNLAFLTSVLFGLLGLEMAATHAQEMKNPRKDYPRSLWVSVVLILATIILASLAVAVVVPDKDLKLATGIMQAFQAFATSYHLPWLLPVSALCIILGGFAQVGAWIIGPTKGLQIAAQDGLLPKYFAQTNSCNVPSRILVLQAILVSVLSLGFIFLPTVNNSYWILSVTSAQLALLVYIILFAAALKLHYTKPDVTRSFKIPGKKWGIWIVCTLGSLTCALVILIGFIPPTQIPFQNLFLYELTLIISMAICCLLPLVLYRRR